MIRHKLLLGVILKYTAVVFRLYAPAYIKLSSEGGFFEKAQLTNPLNIITMNERVRDEYKLWKFSDCVIRVVKCSTVTIIVDTYLHIELNSFRAPV